MIKNILFLANFFTISFTHCIDLVPVDMNGNDKPIAYYKVKQDGKKTNFTLFASDKQFEIGEITVDLDREQVIEQGDPKILKWFNVKVIPQRHGNFFAPRGMGSSKEYQELFIKGQVETPEQVEMLLEEGGSVYRDAHGKIIGYVTKEEHNNSITYWLHDAMGDVLGFIKKDQENVEVKIRDTLTQEQKNIAQVIKDQLLMTLSDRLLLLYNDLQNLAVHIK